MSLSRRIFTTSPLVLCSSLQSSTALPLALYTGRVNAAEFSELLQRRRSIRSFLPTPLPAGAIDEILEDARHIPSWSNTRPYCVAVASGEQLERLRERYVEAFDASLALRTLRTPRTDTKSGEIDAAVAPLSPEDLADLTRLGTPDGDFPTRLRYPDELRERSRACGLGLYSQLGITREDVAGRQDAARRNLAFFGAPVAMWIFVHESMLPFSAQDAGILLHTIFLSAQVRGIDSCPLGELATWRHPIDSEFDVPAGYQLITGLALGCKDDDGVNQFRAEHPPVTLVASTR